MMKGRVWQSGQHEAAGGIGAALRDAYSTNDIAADRRMQDLIDQMKAIETRSRPTAD
jgi:hypothetical protein